MSADDEMPEIDDSVAPLAERLNLDLENDLLWDLTAGTGVMDRVAEALAEIEGLGVRLAELTTERDEARTCARKDRDARAQYSAWNQASGYHDQVRGVSVSRDDHEAELIDKFIREMPLPWEGS